MFKEALAEERPPEEFARLSRFLVLFEESPFEAVHNRKVLAAEVENLFKELAYERP